jgi:hypothetical protein
MHYLAGMARAQVVYEVPLWSVLDEHDVDQLLQKLRAVHGEARFDLAPSWWRRRAQGACAEGPGNASREINALLRSIRAA